MSIALIETVQHARLLTAEELLALPNEKDFELLQGVLVERSMGNESSQIAVLLASALISFVRPRNLGWILSSDGGYVLPLDGRDTVRKPDVSFVGIGRFPAGQPLPTGYYKLAPDLAAEVLSPGDLVYEVDQKIAEYLNAGVRLVWVVHPVTRTVMVHRQDRSTYQLRDTDFLDGEEVLPGFRCLVSEIFLIPTAQG